MPISIKGTGCKSGGCVRKAVELTSGDLLFVWKSRDPLWADGLGCECFADFIQPVRWLEHTLSLQDPERPSSCSPMVSLCERSFDSAP
jgi:hypothetical protein